MHGPTSGVEIEQVSRVFDAGLNAVDQLTLRVPAGEFLAILGPSGCGKSTLLRMIAGLDHPTAGRIVSASKEMAYVFQDAHLLPWRTAAGNIALPLELKRVHRRARASAVASAIEQVGLKGFADAYPAQLSGGMRMRVSLARALVSKPTLLLLDEPFAALDEITRHQLDEQLRALWQATAMTVLFVTHSIVEAIFLAQRAVVLSHRPARVILDHPIDLPAERNAASRATPGFAHETGILLSALERGKELAE